MVHRDWVGEGEWERRDAREGEGLPVTLIRRNHLVVETYLI